MRNILFAIAVTAAIPLPASAQSFQPGGQYSNDDRRVSVGLTIPFGGGGSRSERKPRVDMTFDHHRRDTNGFELRERASFKSQRPVRLGFTLSEKPQMMLNGRMILRADGRRNLSTGALIGIGVGVALVGGALVLDSVIDRSKCCE